MKYYLSKNRSGNSLSIYEKIKYDSKGDYLEVNILEYIKLKLISGYNI